jgi:hypothetical protein
VSEPDHHDPTNLTGVWSGLFKQTDLGADVTFTATLIESGSLVTGSTHEPCVVSDCPRKTHLATLSGTRNGRAVSFLKTYDPPGFGYSTVSYDGTLNGDATEIAGQWNIRQGLLSMSGEFLMIRAGRRAAVRAQKKLVTERA